jgi:hypothetical protein
MAQSSVRTVVFPHADKKVFIKTSALRLADYHLRNKACNQESLIAVRSDGPAQGQLSVGFN